MQYVDECCHVFYEWPLNTVLHKKILHHQRWRPHLRFHCRQNLLVTLHYSKSFKWMRSNRNTGKMYKIIYTRIFEKILWLSKTSLVRRATFEVIFRPYEIVVVCRRLGQPDDWEYMDPCCNAGE